MNDHDGGARGSGAVPGAERGRNSRPLQSDSRESALRVAEQLRKVTLEAPLQSLLAAFLLEYGWLGGARRGAPALPRKLKTFDLVGSVTLNGAGAIRARWQLRPGGAPTIGQAAKDPSRP